MSFGLRACDESDKAPELSVSCLIGILLFQVSGPYLNQYEVYYKRLDPEERNEIGAMDAAKFLKLSGMSDENLGKVRNGMECRMLCSRRR